MYKLKKYANEKIKDTKRDLMIKGYTIKSSIDLTEFFVHLLIDVLFRYLLTIIVVFYIELDQLDVKTVILQKNLNEEII